MDIVTLKSRVGTDGVLTVSIPLGAAEADHEVLVVVRPMIASAVDDHARQAWARFLAEYPQGRDDPTFYRHEQGELEERESLD